MKLGKHQLESYWGIQSGNILLEESMMTVQKETKNSFGLVQGAGLKGNLLRGLKWEYGF